jgi:hypothetical protein
MHIYQATIILDMVQNLNDQIPLLLFMQKKEVALQKAVNSDDTDLIYITLIAIYVMSISNYMYINIQLHLHLYVFKSIYASQ